MADHEVFAQHLSQGGSVVTTQCAQVMLDTDLEDRHDTFKPVELLLAAVAGGLLEGVARARSSLELSVRGVAVRVHGRSQDAPSKLSRIDYTMWLESDESDQRLELLHEHLKEVGTVFNTVAAGCPLAGTLNRGRPE